MSEIAFPGNDPFPDLDGARSDLAEKYGPRVLPGDGQPEYPDEYVRRSALPHPRRAPMCGPPLDEGTLERQRLMADAILLERAAAAIRRRIPARGDYVLSALGMLQRFAGDWREQAEAPD